MVAFGPQLPPLTSPPPGGTRSVPGSGRPPADGDRLLGDRAQRGHGPAATVSVDGSTARIAQAAHLYHTQASALLARDAAGSALSALREMAALAGRAGGEDVPEDARGALAQAFAAARDALDAAAGDADFGGVNLLAGQRVVRTVTNLSGVTYEVRGWPLGSAALGLADADPTTAEGARAAAEAARRAEAAVTESVALFAVEASVARLQRESIREMTIILNRGLSAAVKLDVGEGEARSLAGRAASIVAAGGRPIFSNTAGALDILSDAAAA